MKRMSYKSLMKKCAEGYAEVYAWSGDYADVFFFRSNGTTRREIIEVTNIPQETTLAA